MPNWLFDVVCVSPDVARVVSTSFAVPLREVHKPRGGATGVMQILPAVTPEFWYDPDELATAVKHRHREYYGDETGTQCPACDQWKWLPVSEGEAPIRGASLTTDADVIASPEVFGSGLSSFRHILFRASLAELLLAANPRSWSIRSVTFA